jgi:hypothetical protein
MYFDLSIDLAIEEIITSEGASIVEQSTESKYEKLFRVLGKLVPGINCFTQKKL